MCSITATNDIVQFEIDESASAEKSCYDHEDVPLLDFEEYLSFLLLFTLSLLVAFSRFFFSLNI